MSEASYLDERADPNPNPSPNPNLNPHPHPNPNPNLNPNPNQASGPLPGVYATPSEGPHFPCAVKGGSPPFNGQQIPCDDGSSKSLAHTQSPDNLTVFISNFNIEEVPLMSFGSFQVKFKYTATWSDRYAVHPCAVNL